jgi:hypothetical protein
LRGGYGSIYLEIAREVGLVMMAIDEWKHPVWNVVSITKNGAVVRNKICEIVETLN